MGFLELLPLLLVIAVGALGALLFRAVLLNPPTRRKVMRRVRSEYTAAEAELVFAELDAYSGRETYRVLMDILKLSAGSLKDLKRWVKMAQNDYREVISAAEYSGSEVGSKILREFHAWKPSDRGEELSFKDLLEEDPVP